MDILGLGCRVSQNEGYTFGGSYNKDSNIVKIYIGAPTGGTT